MVGRTIQLKKQRKAEWLNSLLNIQFFDPCEYHHNFGKNEKNLFCIDCRLCLCRHCSDSSDHYLHKSLKICRYVYHDVVRLQDMQKHYDCSKIQTYKINSKMAVHLNARRPSNDNKTSKMKDGSSCLTCGRYLQDWHNRFCSIECKENSGAALDLISEVDDISMKGSWNSEGNNNENESSITLGESYEESPPPLSPALKPKKQSHKRKAIPHRAPFI